MTEMLEVFCLAKGQIEQGQFGRWSFHVSSCSTEDRTAKFATQLMGDSETEAILQRLDRLSHEEAQVTMAHTLNVVHGLVNNLKVAMDGT